MRYGPVLCQQTRKLLLVLLQDDRWLVCSTNGVHARMMTQRLHMSQGNAVNALR
jgi:hypothetical protein